MVNVCYGYYLEPTHKLKVNKYLGFYWQCLLLLVLRKEKWFFNLELSKLAHYHGGPDFLKLANATQVDSDSKIFDEN